MVPLAFSNWLELHKLLEQEETRRFAAGHDPTRVRILKYRHLAIKLRLERAEWFLEKLTELCQKGFVGELVIRYFDAFALLLRGVLELETFFLNELCRLGIPEDAVSIHSVRTALLQEGRWPDLTTLLDAELGVGVARTWFWHFNRLRATALYGELPELLKNAAPSKPEDKIYLSVNPNDPKSVRHDPKLELGTYSRDKFDHMYELIEKIDLVLASLIGQNLIQL